MSFVVLGQQCWHSHDVSPHYVLTSTTLTLKSDFFFCTQGDFTAGGSCHEDVRFNPHCRCLCGQCPVTYSSCWTFFSLSNFIFILTLHPGCYGGHCQGGREANGRCRVQPGGFLCYWVSHRGVFNVPCQNGHRRWATLFFFTHNTL